MASVDAKSIPEIKRFMEDYWKLVKMFWIAESTDEYWTALVDAVDYLYRTYSDDFCHKALLAFSDYADAKCRKEGKNGNTT